MRNAWGQFGGHRKLGAQRPASAVLYATLVACDPLTVMEESDPSKLTVMYSGCHTVQEGPLCELPKLGSESATRPLTLHIELQAIPTITIQTAKGESSWTSAQCSDDTCVKTESGHRIVLSIPESARRVIVKSGHPEISNWTLPIIDFRERPAVMSDAVALERSSQRDEALQLLETALSTLDLHWQAEAMSHIARMYKRLGKAEEALQSFEQSMDPSSADRRSQPLYQGWYRSSSYLNHGRGYAAQCSARPCVVASWHSATALREPTFLPLGIPICRQQSACTSGYFVSR